MSTTMKQRIVIIASGFLHIQRFIAPEAKKGIASALFIAALFINPIIAEAAMHWGDFQKDSCIDNGVRQYSSRLWDIPIGAKWDTACKGTVATINGNTYNAPARCIDKGALGMWGEFNVPDQTCQSRWGDFQKDGCTKWNVRQYSSRLWDIPSGMPWDTACKGTGATINGITYNAPTRCMNKGAFGMWGEFDIPDQSCPHWGAFTRKTNGCTSMGIRTYQAQLMDVPADTSWENACPRMAATVSGIQFSTPSRCYKDMIGEWGEFYGIPDSSCPHWTVQKHGCTEIRNNHKYYAVLDDLPPGISWENACKSTPADIGGTHFTTPTECLTKSFTATFTVQDRQCTGVTVVTSSTASGTTTTYTTNYGEKKDELKGAPAVKKPVVGKTVPAKVAKAINQYCASYTVGPLKIVAGTAAVVPVTIKNCSDVGWSPAAGIGKNGLGFVMVAHRWYKDGKKIQGSEVSTKLTQAAASGDTITLKVAVNAPRTPGQYEIRWDMVVPVNTRFSSKGIAQKSQAVQVTPNAKLLLRPQTPK